jgi:gamma-glutamylcyclotransferase
VVWYFAYGSNMQSATLRGRRGVHYHRALPGRARGWRLVLDKPGLIPTGESVANIVPEAAAELWGVLFEIDAADLGHIDLTEGVLIGNYTRVEIPVEPVAAEPALQAFTLTSNRRDPGLRPSTRYMDLLISGAEEHRLPAEYIAFLRSIPARPESPEAAQLRPFFDDALRRR